MRNGGGKTLQVHCAGSIRYGSGVRCPTRRLLGTSNHKVAVLSMGGHVTAMAAGVVNIQATYRRPEGIVLDGDGEARCRLLPRSRLLPAALPTAPGRPSGSGASQRLPGPRRLLPMNHLHHLHLVHLMDPCGPGSPEAPEAATAWF